MLFTDKFGETNTIHSVSMYWWNIRSSSNERSHLFLATRLYENECWFQRHKVWF